MLFCNIPSVQAVNPFHEGVIMFLLTVAFFQQVKRDKAAHIFQSCSKIFKVRLIFFRTLFDFWSISQPCSCYYVTMTLCILYRNRFKLAC